MVLGTGSTQKIGTKKRQTKKRLEKDPPPLSLVSLVSCSSLSSLSLVSCDPKSFAAEHRPNPDGP